MRKLLAMVQSKATTVGQYLKELPEDRRRAIAAIRTVILANIDAGIEEVMSYGMISYHVSLKVYPDGYHCDPQMPLPYLAIASQKKHLAVYMMGLYMDPDDTAWFAKAWKAAGKKLDMGKSCVRFKKLEDAALHVLAEALRRMPSQRYIATYEANLIGIGQQRKPATTKKAPAKKAPAKKARKALSTKEIAAKAIAKRVAKK